MLRLWPGCMVAMAAERRRLRPKLMMSLFVAIGGFRGRANDEDNEYINTSAQHTAYSFDFSGIVVIMRYEPHMILELDSCIVALMCLAIFAQICYIGSFHHWLLTAHCVRRDDWHVCFFMNGNMGHILNNDDRHGGIGHYCQYCGYFWVHTVYHHYLITQCPLQSNRKPSMIINRTPYMANK